jgi:hypothetical protein
MKTEKDPLKLLSKEELYFLANYLPINLSPDKFKESALTEIEDWTIHHHEAFKKAYQNLQLHARNLNIKLDAFIEAGIMLNKTIRNS